MSTECESRPNRDTVTELLAGYLCASGWLRWPGTDGMTVGDVIEAVYPVAAAAGWVPGPDELARRHAELADAIAAHFRADGSGSADR